MSAVGMVMSEEEKAFERKKEAARRVGNKFIKVRWNGAYQEPEQLRFHGARDVFVKMVNDPKNPSRKVMEAFPGFGTVSFKRDEITGELTAELWDDPEMHNRYWLSRHLRDIEVLDSESAAEIEKLAEKGYKVELTEEEELIRDIEWKQRRLKQLQNSSKPKEKRAPPIPAKTQLGEKKNGNNKSDMYLG